MPFMSVPAPSSVSAYPLALWLAASWRRLNWEPLPTRVLPDADWRLAHEMGAANEGYVWPQIVFASDNEAMHVWSAPPTATHEQSVRYLASCSATMPPEGFRAGVDEFVSVVVSRLAAVGHRGSGLAQLWELVLADRQDEAALRYRQIEPALGFDPEEGPQALMREAMSLDREMGAASLSERAPL